LHQTIEVSMAERELKKKQAPKRDEEEVDEAPVASE
jgi:hypothetical protein